MEDLIDAGDTAWMLTATVLVILMTPGGITLFYSGLTEYNSTLDIIWISYVSFFIATISWYIIGYSLVFEGDNPYIWNFKGIFLSRVEVFSNQGRIP